MSSATVSTVTTTPSTDGFAVWNRGGPEIDFLNTPLEAMTIEEQTAFGRGKFEVSNFQQKGTLINVGQANNGVSRVEVTPKHVEELFRCYIKFNKTNRQLRRDLYDVRLKLKAMEHQLEESRTTALTNGKLRVEKDQLTQLLRVEKQATQKVRHDNFVLSVENRALRTMETNWKEFLGSNAHKKTLILRKSLKNRNKRLKELQEEALLRKVFKSSQEPSEAYASMVEMCRQYPDLLRAPRMAQFKAEILAEPLVSDFEKTIGNSASLLKFCQKFLVDPHLPQQVCTVASNTSDFVKQYLTTLERPDPAAGSSRRGKVFTRLRNMVEAEQERQVELGWIRLKEEERFERVLRREEFEELEREEIEMEGGLTREQMTCEEFEELEQNDKDGGDQLESCPALLDEFDEPAVGVERQFEQSPKENKSKTQLLESHNLREDGHEAAREPMHHKDEQSHPERVHGATTFRKTSTEVRGPKRKKVKMRGVPSFEDCEAAERRLMERLHGTR